MTPDEFLWFLFGVCLVPSLRVWWQVHRAPVTGAEADRPI